MTTQSEAWAHILNCNDHLVSDGDLMNAYAEVNNAIHCLSRIGCTSSVVNLIHWSEKISQIQFDRQAANRPELSSNVRLRFSDGHVAFYGLPGDDWTTDTSEQTEQLRKQLEAVYETTTMVKR